MSEHKHISHYQREDSRSQATEGELPSRLSISTVFAVSMIHTDTENQRGIFVGEGVVSHL